MLRSYTGMNSTLHIITGSPGAGKTTYGLNLAQQLGACFLDTDTVTERMVKLSLALLNRDTDDRDSSFFKTNFRDEIYEATFDIALQNLRHVDVVLVGPFTREIREKNWHKSLESRFMTNVEIHYLYCDSAIRKQRICKRQNPRDASKLEDWETINAYYGQELRPEFPHHFVNTTASLN